MTSNNKLTTSFKHAFAGILHVVRTQRNARIHLLTTAAVVVIGVCVGLSLPEWAILALTVGLVLVTEWFNTVTEVVVDLVSPEYHPLAKVAKDVAAGGVLVTAGIAVVVGLLILGPPLFRRMTYLF